MPVSASRPFAGLTVVAIEQAVAAPFCSSRLADGGAGAGRLAGVAEPVVLCAHSHVPRIVWLPGGMSQLESYDMKPNAPVEYRGVLNPIRTNVPGISAIGDVITLGNGPHPQLAHVSYLHALMNQSTWRVGQIAFHGGTSLHLSWHSPRHSEDLDFLLSSQVDDLDQVTRRCRDRFDARIASRLVAGWPGEWEGFKASCIVIYWPTTLASVTMNRSSCKSPKLM